MGERDPIALELSRGGTLAKIGIGIPPVNVLTVAHLELLARRVSQARGARVLVLTGLPRAFSAGVEVADHLPARDRIERMLSAMRSVLTGLLETPAVTVAAVSGACLGGGAEIVAACDLVFVAEDARVGFPEIRLACFPPGAIALLPQRIGEARSADWILTGRTFSGREAAEAGLASRALPAEGLETETDRAVDELLSKSPAALTEALELLRKPRRDKLDSALSRAEESYRRLTGNVDLARAVEEFKKR